MRVRLLCPVIAGLAIAASACGSSRSYYATPTPTWGQQQVQYDAPPPPMRDDTLIAVLGDDGLSGLGGLAGGMISPNGAEIDEPAYYDFDDDMIETEGLALASAPDEARRGGRSRSGSSGARMQTREASPRANTQVAAAPAPAPQGPPNPQMPPGPDADRVADSSGEAPAESDESGGPLLIYTGSVVLAIYDVGATQDAAAAMIAELGGFIAHRSNQRMLLRVPARHFHTALENFYELGDVLGLDYTANDVSDQHRDLMIRLENSLDMRDRLAELLGTAANIEEALMLERELERVTLEIERIRGQLRVLDDRISFSTIDLRFSAIRTTDVPDQDYRLPFGWLNQLGLPGLLQL